MAEKLAQTAKEVEAIRLQEAKDKELKALARATVAAEVIPPADKEALDILLAEANSTEQLTILPEWYGRVTARRISLALAALTGQSAIRQITSWDKAAYDWAVTLVKKYADGHNSPLIVRRTLGLLTAQQKHPTTLDPGRTANLAAFVISMAILEEIADGKPPVAN